MQKTRFCIFDGNLILRFLEKKHPICDFGKKIIQFYGFDGKTQLRFWQENKILWFWWENTISYEILRFFSFDGKCNFMVLIGKHYFIVLERKRDFLV